MESRVELFEQIRRERDREGLSIRALAERHGVHRRAVRAALVSALPPGKRSPVSRPAPKLGAYRALIDAWLDADLDAPRKQRHTAKRIHRRLVDEHGADVAETTVRDYVRLRKRAIGWPVGEVVSSPVTRTERCGVDWGPRRSSGGGADDGALVLVRGRFGRASPGVTVEPRASGVARRAWSGSRVFERAALDNLPAVNRSAGTAAVRDDRFVALPLHTVRL